MLFDSRCIYHNVKSSPSPQVSADLFGSLKYRNGNGAEPVLAMQNMAYAKDGPPHDGSGYVDVNHEQSAAAAEGPYATVDRGEPVGGIPPVTYASVDKSKKKKKKKKGDKVEEEDSEATATYAQVDKSKKKKKSGASAETKPEENTYASVDMSKKKKVMQFLSYSTADSCNVLV